MTSNSLKSKARKLQASSGMTYTKALDEVKEQETQAGPEDTFTFSVRGVTVVAVVRYDNDYPVYFEVITRSGERACAWNFGTPIEDVVLADGVYEATRIQARTEDGADLNDLLTLAEFRVLESLDKIAYGFTVDDYDSREELVEALRTQMESPGGFQV